MPNQSNEGNELPENIASLFEHVGVVDMTTLEPDTQELLADSLLRGECMTCHAPLGAQTVLIINSKGITAGYCGGACLQDMATLGWLTEQHSDIMDAINFRGGKVDADGEQSEPEVG